MAKARALDKRRKSIRNIRKITRTMELIATARFKKAMDRATAATAYTKRISQLVADLAHSGADLHHPLLEKRAEVQTSLLLVLTANRGLCGGYNASVLRAGLARRTELLALSPHLRTEVAGKRGINAFKFRKLPVDEAYYQFEDQPKFLEVSLLADRYLEAFVSGQIDRLDVAYTQFLSSSRQIAVVETLLPLSEMAGVGEKAEGVRIGESSYEFLPSAASILEEVVPASFRVKLFKCFLDAAVSEQIARMVAMKSATDNAGKLIRRLTTAYNRARQSSITSELMDIMGGVEALKT